MMQLVIYLLYLSFSKPSTNKIPMLNRIQFKKVLQLSLDWCRPKDPPISLGAASIISHLRKHKVDVTPLSYNVNSPHFDTDAVIQDIFASSPNEHTLLGIGAFIWNETTLQDILSKLHSYNFPGKVLLGGPQVSYATANLEEYYPLANIFCRGYAEDAVLQLVTSSTTDNPFPTIGGVVYKGLPDMKLQATCNLETLSSPFLDGIVLPQRFLRWETQRGCPFRCSFCQHRESDLPTASSFQTRQPLKSSRILKEVEWLTKKHITDIAVIDPTFNAGPNYLEVMNSFIHHQFQGKLALQCRFEMIKDAFLEKVAQLNLLGARIVLEFGLQTVIKNESKAIHRPNQMKKVKDTLTKLKAMNIEYEVSLIFGLPLQTLNSFVESVNFCLNSGVPVVKAWPLMILRGTPLDTKMMREAYGLKEMSISASDEIDRVQVNIPHVVSSATFSYEEWVKMTKIAAVLARTEGQHPDSIDIKDFSM